MSNQPESATYDVGVYQLEITDPVQGGVGGLSNTPLLNLANRTTYLKSHIDAIEAGTFIPPTVAPLNSPVFTGDPQAPTAPAGDNDLSIANTSWVNRAISGLVSVNVAGNSNVTLTAAQYGYGIIKLTGALTGNINVIFPAQADRWTVWNATSGAFSIACKTASGAGVAVTQGKSHSLKCDGTDISPDRDDFNSVALTGTPTAPTAASGDNSTTIANTAFVQDAANDAGIVNAIVFGG